MAICLMPPALGVTGFNVFVLDLTTIFVAISKPFAAIVAGNQPR